VTDTDRASEVRAKLELVRGWLDAHHRQAVLFRCQANFAWITAGGRSHISLGEAAGVASVLVGPDEYFAVARQAGSVRKLSARIASLEAGGDAGRESSSGATILALATALQAHDRQTRGHAERVRV